MFESLLSNFLSSLCRSLENPR